MKGGTRGERTQQLTTYTYVKTPHIVMRVQKATLKMGENTSRQRPSTGVCHDAHHQWKEDTSEGIMRFAMNAVTIPVSTNIKQAIGTLLFCFIMIRETTSIPFCYHPQSGF